MALDTLLLEDGFDLLLEDGGRLLLESAAPVVIVGRVVNLCGHDRSVVSLPATDRSVVYLRASAEESTCRH